MALRLSLLLMGLAVLLMGLAVLPVSAQPLITGRILDLDRAEPMPGVRVALCAPRDGPTDPPRVTWTDAQGRYLLPNVPPGSRCVRVLYLEQDVGYLLISPLLTITETPVEGAGQKFMEYPNVILEKHVRQLVPFKSTKQKQPHEIRIRHSAKNDGIGNQGKDLDILSSGS
jgi:hypothetical protein